MPTHWLIPSASCCRWYKVSLPKARSSLAPRASKTKGKNGFLYARNQSPAQMQRMPAFPDSTARARFQDSAGRMLSGPHGTCKPAGIPGLGWEGDALPWKGISGGFVYEDGGVQKEMGGAQQNSQGGISLGGVGIQVGFSTHMLPDSLLGLGKGKALLHFRVLLPGDAGGDVGVGILMTHFSKRRGDVQDNPI